MTSNFIIPHYCRELAMASRRPVASSTGSSESRRLRVAWIADPKKTHGRKLPSCFGWLVGLVGWLGCGVVLVVLFVRLGGDRLGGLIWGIYIKTLYRIISN